MFSPRAHSLLMATIHHLLRLQPALFIANDRQLTEDAATATIAFYAAAKRMFSCLKMMCTSSAVTSVLTHTKLLNTPQRLQPLCSYATISLVKLRLLHRRFSAGLLLFMYILCG